MTSISILSLISPIVIPFLFFTVAAGFPSFNRPTNEEVIWAGEIYELNWDLDARYFQDCTIELLDADSSQYIQTVANTQLNYGYYYWSPGRDLTIDIDRVYVFNMSRDDTGEHSKSPRFFIRLREDYETLSILPIAASTTNSAAEGQASQPPNESGIAGDFTQSDELFPTKSTNPSSQQTTTDTSQSTTGPDVDNSMSVTPNPRNSLSNGAIAGIAVGVSLGAIIFLCMAWLVWRYRRRAIAAMDGVARDGNHPTDGEIGVGGGGGKSTINDTPASTSEWKTELPATDTRAEMEGSLVVISGKPQELDAGNGNQVRHELEDTGKLEHGDDSRG